MSLPFSESKNEPRKNKDDAGRNHSTVSPKRPLAFYTLHGVISQKIEPFITAAVGTSNPTEKGTSSGLGPVVGLWNYDIYMSQLLK
jgi:hypothetical protein